MVALNPTTPCCGLYCLVSMSSGKPSSPYTFQNVFPCTVDVGSALFFERVSEGVARWAGVP